ncbi:carboxylating nicotinate-nucleotide diphosphorylase [Candidatus Methylacidithermus pantelleriae]|uniref:Probable nicotinate-nucleotide pyrophosphorylase [carboxylating] n=1 Tax=Candidatus Methylacidithermus pantelleriae TaxID=2744239 RepID=A0A8J2FRC7_9BACT|nr:carboxylating nicotinate-nucleotide diphosphorylase [Candidatus Methylacidithermus pantelleriae]CAF0689655.1 Quinolinate phosphoribosyltransferase (decarboxylating) [Candidatus Methylacidithermus pantelleriae]
MTTISGSKDSTPQPLRWERLWDSHQKEIQRLIRAAFREDCGPFQGAHWEKLSQKDVTTRWFVPPGTRAQARVVAKEPCVVCGVALAALCFRKLDPSIQWVGQVAEGERVEAGQVVLTVVGHLQAIATAERVALNFLGRLSGIATMARNLVEALGGARVTLLDTRKTTPGLRILEKYAVACGGMENHRWTLGEMVLLKDTHLVYYRNENWKELAERISQFRQRFPGVPVWIEAETLGEARQFASLGVDGILLDNFSLEELRQAVNELGKKVQLEASGGIGLGNLREVAQTGVVRISLGQVTRAAVWSDFSLQTELLSPSG